MCDSTKMIRIFAYAAALCFCLAGITACDPRPDTVTAAQIHVISAPAGATVLLNGVHEGHTPVTLAKTSPGKHLLQLRKPGYREARTSVLVQPGERIAVEMNLEPLTGLVLIHSEPEGADVEIDDANYGKTPLLLPQIPLGQYRLRVSAPNHLPKTMNMTVADKTPVKIDVPLVSDTARVAVNSTPPGASVAIGGVTRGTTPLTIRALPTGTHQIRLSFAGYEPYTDEISVQAGDKRELQITLTHLPGTLSVTSQPRGARIYVEDRLKGEAPVALTNMPPGEHVVRAELRGYESLSSTQSVVFGKTTSVEFEMVKNSGTLMISTAPSGVRVFIDGEDMGVTAPSAREPISSQMKIDFVPQGDRRLQLTKQGYFDLVKTVEVSPDQMVILHEELRPRPVPFIPNVIIRTGHGPGDTHEGIIRKEYPDGTIELEKAGRIFIEISPDKIISKEPIPSE